MDHQTVIMLNATFVRPEKFYLSGFSNMSHAKYFYVFLCFVYVVTVLGNTSLISVIFLAKTLHTAKYMIVFNLALTDLCESTALIPKLLDTFLFDNRYIIYEACLSYMFYVLFFTAIQSWTLLTMAYDRFVAICFPLRYHAIVTKPAVAAILMFIWCFLVSLVAFGISLIDRLSFCRSSVINSFFCDHAPTLKLSCSDVSLNSRMAYAYFITVLMLPFILILMSYARIALALIKIASGAERIKALKTCSSHLILVIIFFLPMLSTNIASVSNRIHPNARMINSTLTHTIPSLLNPIIYSLKTEEVLNSIKKLYKRKSGPSR
uniref:Olfactory receptor 1-like n=1 Tax=Myripristis murdjan TaxID=586833 RepID=A0A667X908_9TELE